MEKIDPNNPFRKTVLLQMKLVVNTKPRDCSSQSLEYKPMVPLQPKQQKPPSNSYNSGPKQVEKVLEPLFPQPGPSNVSKRLKKMDKEYDTAGFPDENDENRPCLATPSVPQNAIMTLRNLKDVTMGEFDITNNPTGGFIASITINTKVYEGHGRSKKVAKNDACEKALRDYLLAKEKPRNNVSSEKVLPKPGTSKCSSSKGVVRMDRSAANNIDETMADLAAFALYKMLTEWRSEGFKIPSQRPNVPAADTSNDEQPPEVCTGLPPNWETMHPGSVLCCMGHIFTYIDKGYAWAPSNIHLIRSYGINVGGKDFVATGSSIKGARRNVSAVACNALYNTNYELLP